MSKHDRRTQKAGTLKKRIFGIGLSLLMIVGMLPFATFGAAAGTNSGVLDRILTPPEDDPAGYNKNDTANPYNAVAGQPFLLSEENELFVFRSADIHENGNNGNHVFIGDTLDTTQAFDKLVNISGEFEEGTTAISGFSESDFRSVNSAYTLSYMEAVAFDPFGTGRKDHIAYTGYDYLAGKTRVIVVDTKGNYLASADIATSSEFFGTEAGQSVGQHEAANFFAITAGRYSNGYKGEHLVAYAHDAGTSVKLIELTLKKSGSTYSLSTVSSLNKTMFNDGFTVDPGTGGDFKKRLSRRLAADLTTGDFNGDGIDDLAVVSQMHRPYDDKSADYSANVFMPYVAIAYGGSGNIVQPSNIKGAHIYEEKVDSNQKKRFSVTGAGIDAGDVDGDGVDEIVLSGVSASVTVAANGRSAVKNDPQPDKDTSRIAVISGEGNAFNYQLYDAFDNPAILKNDNGFNTSDKVWQHMKPTCVAVDGQNSAEYVFYMGYMIKITTGKTSVDIKYTQSYFETAKGSGADQVYIQSAAAGNFDGNDLGREQLVYVIGIKRADMEDYSHELGFISASKYTLDGNVDGTPETPSEGRFGIASEFDCNDPFKNNLTGENGASNEKKVNAFVLAIDNDSDGVVGVYKGKELLYTDPQVKAVLQAAPYFGELSEYADMEGSTSYNISTSYTIGSSKGEETSWSVGMAGEIETPICKLAMEAGYVGALSKEYTQEKTVTYGRGFVANHEDTVVIERVPLQIFEYEVTGAKGTSTLSVQVPMDPTYHFLSIDEYNTFVGEYNKYVDDGYNTVFDRQNSKTAQAKEKMKLKKIEANYLMDNEGNPWKYLANYDGFVAFDDTIAALGHVSGSATMTYETSDAVGESVTSSHGFSIGLSVLFGANTPVGGATFGITSNMETSFSTGTYTSTANTGSTVGEVKHIPNNLITTLSADVLNAYNFSWMYGKWDLELTGDTSIKTPVYGYQVVGVTAPAAVVTDLSGELGEDTTSVVLTWSAPDISKNTGRKAADGYYVYTIDDTGEYQKLDVAVSGNATDGYSCTVTGLPAHEDARFAVAGYIGDKVGAYSNTYMTNSVEAAIATAIAAADKAQKTAEKAAADAAEALKIAEEAAKSTAEDLAGAALAQQQAEVAAAAAENAKTAALTAQSAVEAAREAVESGNEDAAKAATDAAVAAAEAAQQAANAASAAAQAAKAASDAQAAQEAAEAAQKAAEAAADSAASDKSAVELAKQQAEAAKEAAETAKAAAEKAAERANIIAGIPGDNGQDGTDGTDGADGANGSDGKDGLTPFIGENGNWWIGTKDTGVKASISGNGTTDVDGDGIVSAKLNGDGELLVTLADGSVFRAVSADEAVQANGGVFGADVGTVKTVATAALATSAVSLLWNVIALIVSLIKKKA